MEGRVPLGGDIREYRHDLPRPFRADGHELEDVLAALRAGQPGGAAEDPQAHAIIGRDLSVEVLRERVLGNVELGLAAQQIEHAP